MNRRALFSVIATVALIAGAIPIATLTVTAAVHSVAPEPQGEPHVAVSPTARPRAAASPGSTHTPASTGAPVPAPGAEGSSAPPADRPMAERLRTLAPGDQLITVAQLRDFAESVSDGQNPHGPELWVAEKHAEVECMSAAGFYWDPRQSDYAMTDPSQPSVPVSVAARLALNGNAGMPYHWQDAGCMGQAIHETGSGD